MECNEFLRKLADGGGVIVSSAELTNLQIAIVRETNNFFVDYNGFGYAYLTKEQYLSYVK